MHNNNNSSNGAGPSAAAGASPSPAAAAAAGGGSSSPGVHHPPQPPPAAADMQREGGTGRGDKGGEQAPHPLKPSRALGPALQAVIEYLVRGPEDLVVLLHLG